MDGVIVDSMPYHFISWYEALRPLGIRVGCLYVYRKEGERWEKTLAELLKAHRKRVSPRLVARVFAAKQRIFRKYFRRYIFSGTRELLAGLKEKRLSLALVTSTPSAEVRLMLPREIFARFDAVVSGDMVSRGKPFPDPYLKAAAMLGVRPADCFVVENAEIGIRSAKAAGMYCCALTTSLPGEYLKGCDAVRDRLAELPELIEAFIKRRGRGVK
jgi:beta-phosphoglucomutase